MIEYCSELVDLRGEELHEIWWRGRQWAVTAFGLERLDGTYVIERSRLTEHHSAEHPYSWVYHIGCTKTWADVDDFTTAFFVACAMHGKHLTQRELAMLKKHHAKGKRREHVGRFYAQARTELGITGAMVDVTQLSEICRKAEELADANPIGGTN